MSAKNWDTIRRIMGDVGRLVVDDQGVTRRLVRRWNGTDWEYWLDLAPECPPQFEIPVYDPEAIIICSNANGILLIPVCAFDVVLELAIVAGWEPVGTIPPRDHPDPGIWKGIYLPACKQRVLGVDALGLCGAIEASLDDVPNEDVVDAGKANIGLFEWFCGDRKRFLREFVAFIGDQEFTISPASDTEFARSRETGEDQP
jgi:hypothetical protein